MIRRTALPILLLVTAVFPGGAVAARAEAVDAVRLPERGATSLDGISLGDTFDSVDVLLGLRNILPLQEGEDTFVYRWPGSIQRNEGPLNAGGQKFRRLEIVFRGQRVVEVRTIYSSGMRYTRMGPDLIARYGEPTVVRSGPPREIPVPPLESPEGGEDEPRYSVPENHTKLRYLWVEVWNWQWEEAEFTIIGEHYTPEKNHVEVGQHIFRLKLAAR